ncbi:MAG: DUF952 domain-containing protein [Pelolinea sp.]|jgi:uncharacterized protein (DUF952 family)|nr:DUF952 domain-containing protein [Pelolinea sp.]
MNIYHITPLKVWRKALESGSYDADSLKTDGFIHCCKKGQTQGVLKEWFRGESDLVLLEIDPTLLSAEVKYEDSHGTGELFPHIYGPLNLDAVVGVTICA